MAESATFRASAEMVFRGDEFFQTCATRKGAQVLAELLNRVAALEVEHGHEISKWPQLPASQLIAHAVANVFDWRLELPAERQARLADEAAETANG